MHRVINNTDPYNFTGELIGMYVFLIKPEYIVCIVTR